MSQVFACVQTDQTVHIKHVYLLVNQLYPNKWLKNLNKIMASYFLKLDTYICFVLHKFRGVKSWAEWIKRLHNKAKIREA